MCVAAVVEMSVRTTRTRLRLHGGARSTLLSLRKVIRFKSGLQRQTSSKILACRVDRTRLGQADTIEHRISKTEYHFTTSYVTSYRIRKAHEDNDVFPI